MSTTKGISADKADEGSTSGSMARISEHRMSRIRRILSAKFVGQTEVAGYINSRLEPMIVQDEQFFITGTQPLADLDREPASQIGKGALVRVSPHLLQRIRKILTQKATQHTHIGPYIDSRLEPPMTADEHHIQAMANEERTTTARGSLEKPWRKHT